MYEGIVEQEENTDVYRGNVEHTWTCMIKIVEVVSGHLHNSKNTDLCKKLHVDTNGLLDLFFT